MGGAELAEDRGRSIRARGIGFPGRDALLIALAALATAALYGAIGRPHIYSGFWSGLASAMVLLFAAVAVEAVAPSTRFILRDRWFGATIWLVRTIGVSLLIPPLQYGWARLGVPPLVHMRFGLVGTTLVTIVMVDFLSYWRHRFEHRFFWRFHAVHHSITDLHAANSYGHFLESLPHLFIVLIPLSLIDFGGIEAPLAAMMTVGVLEFYIHAPVTIHFGLLRALIVDNRYHRIHHSIEPRHFEKNFSILFSVWDRFFGTAYMPEPDEWPETGVDGIPEPKSVTDYLLFPVSARFRH